MKAGRISHSSTSGKVHTHLDTTLLTTLEMARKDPLSILEIYLTRWECGESFRFLKQSYNLADVRVQGYVALRNTVSLVMAAFFFIGVVLAAGMRLRILLKKVYEKAKRLFEIGCLLNSMLFATGSIISFGEGNFQTPKNHLLEECLN